MLSKKCLIGVTLVLFCLFFTENGPTEAQEVFKKDPGGRGFFLTEYGPVASHADPIHGPKYGFGTQRMSGFWTRHISGLSTQHKSGSSTQHMSRFSTQHMCCVLVVHHGPILNQNEATASRIIFKHLLGLHGSIFG